MLFLVDGSNVAGEVARAAKDDAAKRELVRLAARIARAERSRVILFFDGNAPASFATRYGSLEVRFSGTGSADDAIAAVAVEARVPVTVVTADRGLGARVAGRRVRIMVPRAFLELAPAEESGRTEDDWEAYFSDPNNRNI